MSASVYNLAIPKAILKSVNRSHRFASPLPLFLLIVVSSFAILGSAPVARAADWNVAEQQLARKISAVTGPGAVAITIENRSSLGRRDSEAVQNGIRLALEQLGLRFVNPEQAAATVAVFLSENPVSYVWLAEIRQSENESSVVMVAVPRSGGLPVAHDSMPMTLRKTLLWSQDDPILDVAVLEENTAPSRIAVLDAKSVSTYRMQNGKWQLEQTLAIPHSVPWPRDLRGRLIPAKDHLLDAYLPGVVCHVPAGASITLNCRDADDPWPLVPEGLIGGSSNFASSNAEFAGLPSTAAFFAPTRNFFSGVLTPALGKLAAVPKFYSAAALPRGKYTLWLFSAVDGQVHVADGVRDQALGFNWCSDIATLKTSCGSGWQVLATTAGDRATGSVRAYEFPDRDPVAVSAAADLPGEATALWTEAKGDTAVVIVKDEETGGYEAFRLALACNQ